MNSDSQPTPTTELVGPAGRIIVNSVDVDTFRAQGYMTLDEAAAITTTEADTGPATTEADTGPATIESDTPDSEG